MVRPADVAEWQTRRLQVPVSFGTWRFKSSHPHSRQRVHATATASAAQTSSIRPSLRRPTRSTSTSTATLSTESRFTADGRGIGSASGDSRTSLGSPRSVVVHGATIARLSLGIAASLERTTTGRRPMSDSSHHQTSPRAGSAFTTTPRPRETTRDPPTRPARPMAARRMPHTRHRSPPRDGGRAAHRAPRRAGRSPSGPP